MQELYQTTKRTSTPPPAYHAHTKDSKGVRFCCLMDKNGWKFTLQVITICFKTEIITRYLKRGGIKARDTNSYIIDS